MCALTLPSYQRAWRWKKSQAALIKSIFCSLQLSAALLCRVTVPRLLPRGPQGAPSPVFLQDEGDETALLSFFSVKCSSVIKAQLELRQSALCHCLFSLRLYLLAHVTCLLHHTGGEVNGAVSAGIAQRWKAHTVNDLSFIFLHQQQQSVKPARTIGWPALCLQPFPVQ